MGTDYSRPPRSPSTTSCSTCRGGRCGGRAARDRADARRLESVSISHSVESRGGLDLFGSSSAVPDLRRILRQEDTWVAQRRTSRSAETGIFHHQRAPIRAGSGRRGHLSIADTHPRGNSSAATQVHDEAGHHWHIADRAPRSSARRSCSRSKGPHHRDHEAALKSARGGGRRDSNGGATPNGDREVDGTKSNGRRSRSRG